MSCEVATLASAESLGSHPLRSVATLLIGLCSRLDFPSSLITYPPQPLTGGEHFGDNDDDSILRSKIDVVNLCDNETRRGRGGAVFLFP